MFKRKREELVFRENLTLENEKKCLQTQLEQKDREIVMWTERGNRLSAAYDTKSQELERLQKAFCELIKPDGLAVYRKAIGDLSPLKRQD